MKDLKDTIHNILDTRYRKILPEEEVEKLRLKILKNEIKDLKQARLGSYSITLETRYNIKKYIKEEYTLEIYGEPFSFSEIAKGILELHRGEFEKRFKMRRSMFAYDKKDFNLMLENQPALYVKHTEEPIKGEWVYLDISGYYFNHYRRFIDAYYKRDFLIGYGEGLKYYTDFLERNKVMRNTLYGIMRGLRIVIFKNGKMHIVKVNNRYLNPRWVNFVYDTSQALALYMIRECKAIYYHTDGFIIPFRHLEKAKRFIEELGFKCRIKATGYYVDVKNIGVYAFLNEFGEFVYKSGHYERVHTRNSTNNIQISEKWAKKIWEKIARSPI